MTEVEVSVGVALDYIILIGVSNDLPTQYGNETMMNIFQYNAVQFSTTVNCNLGNKRKVNLIPVSIKTERYCFCKYII